MADDKRTVRSMVATTAVVSGLAIVGIGYSASNLSAFYNSQILGCGDTWSACHEAHGDGVLSCKPEYLEGEQRGAPCSWDTEGYCIYGSTCS